MTDRAAGRPFGAFRLSGGRYDDRLGLPVSTAAELARYEKLVVRVARALYLEPRPRRQRVPAGFAEALDLRIVDVEPGSVIPVLTRNDDDALAGISDIYEDARRAVNDALRAVASGDPLPSGFPVAALTEFASFGRSLQEGEAIDLAVADEPPARLDRAIRQRVQALARLDRIESEVTLQGQITGLQSNPQRFDFALVDGRQVAGSYGDETWWAVLRDYQGFADRAPLVSLSAVARRSLDGSIIDVVDVLGVEPALPPAWSQRLHQLAELRQGWLDAIDAPHPTTIDRAEALLLASLDEGFDRPGIFPSLDGGIQLEWRAPAVEVELLNDGTTRVTVLAGDTDLELAPSAATLDAVLDALLEARERN